MMFLLLKLGKCVETVIKEPCLAASILKLAKCSKDSLVVANLLSPAIAKVSTPVIAAKEPVISFTSEPLAGKSARTWLLVSL